ncbi:MAG: ABC transporter permease [Sphingomonas sp.]
MNVSALTTLYRSIARHRLFAMLNIGGLALGIAVFLVLFLFVRFETTYNHVLPGWDRIWLVQERYHLPGYPEAPNPYSMGNELVQLRGDFPDLEGARFNQVAAIIRQGAAATGEDLATVDANFFRLFPYPAVQGDPNATLADPDGIIITQALARKYFGSQPAIGQTLNVVVDGKAYPYRVGAILRDMPNNMSYKSELFAQLVPARFASSYWDHWGSTSLITFLRFKDAAAAAAFEARLPGFLERHAYPEGNVKKGEYEQSLVPLDGMHLYSPGDRVVVTTLATVGLLTLLIAIVNYVNLATARAGLRAREVALRKVTGGTRITLVRQFLGEAILTVGLAALVGLALAEIALPFINATGGTKLAVSYWGADGIVPPLALLVLVVGVLAGAYPAFALSRFQPAAVLASARAPGGGRAGARLRAGLVIAQFAIAIAFAISTAVMLAQAAHVRAADIGFKRDGLVLVRSFVDGSLTTAQRSELLAAFAAVPGVQSVGRANNAPGDQNTTNFGSMSRPGQPGRKPSVMTVDVDAGYFATYGARLVAGRLFDTAHAEDDRARLSPEQRKTTPLNVVLSVAAIRELGFAKPQDAIGQIVKGDESERRVIGVVDDLRFRSPRDPVPPTAYYFSTGDIESSYAALRYAGATSKQMIDRAEAAWKRVAPAVPFAARTVEDNLFEQYYKQDAQRARLFTIGAALAIFIGCVGLYGLAAFDTARRTKEIGIRKVLGASTIDVFRLLLGQFMRPVLLANLVAWPLAFVAMQRWLSGFDDRVALSPLMFAGASVAAILIATGTIFGQAWRVAGAEPARALRQD